ncbi:MAG: ABC transporter permease [Bacteroidetes bacterium]|nr:ABC transporter permease [Bacteroidota bacterium]MBS1541344.1 ABC transporter permease [Bacteroidota bacterium]
MLTNYLKIALRNLIRNKTYSAINIFGLAIGIACCLLLSLYMVDEWSYDKHHNRLDDLYRIVSSFQSDRGLNKTTNASPAIAMGLKNEIPEIETAVRVLNPPNAPRQLIRYQDKLFYETDGLLADSTLFEVFRYKLIEGNPKKALVEANSVVLSDKLATKLFGNEPAIDKIISITQAGQPQEYKVTGVFFDKYKSHIKANFFISITSSGGIAEYIRTEAANFWAINNFVPSYVRLVKGHDRTAVEKKMNEVLQKYGAKELKAYGMQKSLLLESVKDIYLKSDFSQSPRIYYLYTVGSIAIFILLIACINFMNLSTAKATKRATEIGIRKTMGAFRSSLIKQILGEAMLIVVIAIALSIVITQFSLPIFNQLTGKNILFGRETIIYSAWALLILAIVTGLVAGSYPAFYLSSFQPAEVLKGKLSNGSFSGQLRQGLVVFQFIIAIVLVSAIFVVSDQLKFISNKNLGFNSESKIVLPLRSDGAHQHYQTLKKELLNISQISAVSAAGYMPGSEVLTDMMFYADGGNMDKAILNKRISVDHGYIELMDMKIIAGRAFNMNRKSESKGNVILNRTSAERFGFTPEKAIGQKIHFEYEKNRYDFEVIGVVEDFHQVSMRSMIEPMLFEMGDNDNTFDNVVISLSTTQFDQSLHSIEKIWKSLIPETPFEYSFLDQDIQRQYDEDHKMAGIISGFAAVAIFICCLGLYGLSSYMAERRTKEIGIRKVMGASVQQIVRMISSEFVMLVLVALVIATPIAWYAMNKWLQGFAYRTEISGWIFVWSGVVAVLIALITVSFESMKAALMNPVNSLKSE